MATAELSEVEEAPPISPEPEGLYEIVDGKVVEKTMGVHEVAIANELHLILGAFAKGNHLGWVWCEMLFVTVAATGRSRRPDVAFVSAERWPMGRDLPETTAFEFAPDLAVEVVSPSDLADDLQRKIREYFAAGVRQAWVIYRTTATIVVHESATSARTVARGDVLDGGTILPGFRLAVSDLLAEPKPAEPAGPAS